ncbi:MAG: phosphotransferase family protein [Acidimicrobiales bacterium]
MEGIDEGATSRWLAENVGLLQPVSFELIAGGRSNLTYKVTDAGGTSVVLRRPPTAHVLPTAHDMGREHRVVTALGPTAVPVPRTLGYCTDAAVTGAPFYVMEHVTGCVVRDASSAMEALDEDGRGRASRSLVDVLVGLHAVDFEAVGLGDLGPHYGYISRQLERWHGQFDHSQIEGCARVDAVDRVYERLVSNLAAGSETTIVHGDYRLDNTILTEGGEVAAVLDWEICTLGDPLADLGTLMVYWAEPGDEMTALGAAPTTAPGFWSRRQLCDRYEAATGRDLSGIDYYTAFAYWRVACILQGVLRRYLGGAAGGDRTGVEHFATQIGVLATAAEEASAGLTK